MLLMLLRTYFVGFVKSCLSKWELLSWHVCVIGTTMHDFSGAHMDHCALIWDPNRFYFFAPREEEIEWPWSNMLKTIVFICCFAHSWNYMFFPPREEKQSKTYDLVAFLGSQAAPSGVTWTDLFLCLSLRWVVGNLRWKLRQRLRILWRQSHHHLSKASLMGNVNGPNNLHVVCVIGQRVW